jgi:hypothetical protein
VTQTESMLVGSIAVRAESLFQQLPESRQRPKNRHCSIYGRYWLRPNVRRADTVPGGRPSSYSKRFDPEVFIGIAFLNRV